MNTAVATEQAYEREIKFLERKLPTANIKWQALSAMEQVVSPPLSDGEANDIVARLKDAFGDRPKQAQMPFIKIITTAASKLRGGTRVIISVPRLRDVFAADIDGHSGGGGGRGYNPMSVRPGPRGSS